MMDDEQMCFMTPPKQPVIDPSPWTPTANLKILLKAASPDLHNRELLMHGQNSLNEASKLEACKVIQNVTVANGRHVHSGSNTVKTVVQARTVDHGRRRKEKSLGLLCGSFQQHEVKLDEVAESLGVSRRRVYDIINVLEAIEFASRLAKNKYVWHGNANLTNTVTKFYRLAQLEGLSEQIEQAKICNVTFGPECSSKAVVSDAEKLSLTHLTQKFFMLFLVAPQHTLSLDLSARVLLAVSAAEQPDMSKYKSTIRRLYDIANILISLQLIQKLSVAEVKYRKPSFMYIGPRSKDMAVSFQSQFSAFPVKRPFGRHLSFDQICEVAAIECERMTSVAEQPSSSDAGDHDPTVELNVHKECSPTVAEQYSMSRALVMSASRRHITCLQRTRSDGAIDSSNISKQLTADYQFMSDFCQDENRKPAEQQAGNGKAKKRIYESGQNFSQWPTIKLREKTVYDEISARSDYGEDDQINESGACGVPEKVLKETNSGYKSSVEVKGSFQLKPVVYLTRKVAGSNSTADAAVTVRNLSTTRPFSVCTSKGSSYTTVPLLTSNIVNVNHAGLAAGQSRAVIKPRVILIKRRKNLPPT